MPEAPLHVLESVKATHVREIELGDVSRSLVTEGQAFNSSCSVTYTVPHTTFTVITSLAGTELKISSRLHWARVSAEVHVLKRGTVTIVLDLLEERPYCKS